MKRLSKHEATVSKLYKSIIETHRYYFVTGSTLQHTVQSYADICIVAHIFIVKYTKIVTTDQFGLEELTRDTTVSVHCGYHLLFW